MPTLVESLNLVQCRLPIGALSILAVRLRSLNLLPRGVWREPPHNEHVGKSNPVPFVAFTTVHSAYSGRWSDRILFL